MRGKWSDTQVSDLENNETAAAGQLTVRQIEVLDLGARGLGSKQIARRLGISPRTVEGHLRAMRQRTGAHSTAELITQAIAAGVISAK
jgi:DNA-binding CsgD family transcriptional regulator